MGQTPTLEPTYHVCRAHLHVIGPWPIRVYEWFGCAFRVILCGTCQGDTKQSERRVYIQQREDLDIESHVQDITDTEKGSD